MKYSYSLLAEVALALVLSSCAPSFDTPPDLQPLLQAYANPTAVVGSAIMAEVADEIAEAAEEIQDSEIFEEILQVIIDVQQELDAATVKICDGGAMNGSDCSTDADCPDGTCVSTGDIVLSGICDAGTNEGNDCMDDTDCPGGTCAGEVVIPTPNGQIDVNYVCPGWDEAQFDPEWLKTCDGGANDGNACADNAACPDGTCVEAAPPRENGTINLTMTLDSAGIGRVVWGTVDNCLYLVPIEGGNCAAGCSEASYDGGVAIDLGDPAPSGQDITELSVTFLLEGTIGFDGSAFRINQSFRVTLANTAGLVILVDVGDPALSKTFNYIFAGTAGQAIHDATGLFGCSLEESQCFERICEGGANDGSACTIDADCPEGTCESRERFSW